MAHKFNLNGRHMIEVTLNGETGLCDVVVSDLQSAATYTKSLVLDQYNKLVEYFQSNEHSYAINCAKGRF